MGSARRIADDVNSGRASAVDIAEQSVRAMTALDAHLHFVTEAWPDQARRLATSVERRPDGQRGVLAGVPIMIKDGFRLDTPLVERLVAAGAIPIGVTTRPDRRVTSQAWGWNGSEHTRNPWSLDRTSGGSSAGSAAAVAAGVVPLATGGDSAGSLRIPASFCGVIGMKGTPGRIPRSVRGLAQLTCSGVVAAEIDDLVTAIEVASGSHPLDPLALPPWRCATELEPAVPRVAFSPDLGYAPSDAAVESAVRGRLERLHAGGVVDLRPVPVEVADPTEAWLALYAVDRGNPVDEAALAAALEYRRVLDLTLATVFSQVDVVVTPTTPQTAFPYAEYEDSLPAGDLTWVFNVSGHPAISVPVGLVDGLPVGAQVVAPPHGDGLAVNVARRIIEPLGTPPTHVSHLSRSHLGTPS